MKKKLYHNLWIVAFLAMTTTATAQLQVQLIVPPMNVPVADFLDNTTAFQLIITNTTNQPISFVGEGQLKLDGAVVANLSKNNAPTESINGLRTKRFYLNSLFDLVEDIEFDANMINTIEQTGYFPAGVYEWCFSLYDANNPATVLAASNCRSTFVTTYQPPTLIFPNNQAQVTTRPILRWSPVMPAYTAGMLNYQVQVFEVMNGQDVWQAFRSNQPILERNTPATQLVFPMEIPMTAGLYVWTVRAFDPQGNPVGTPQNYAEPFTFTILEGIATSGSASGTITIPVSAGQFIRIKLSSKADPTYIVQDVIANSTDELAIRRAFELSDQAKDYNLMLSPEFSLKSNDEIAEPIYNVFGDLVSYRTIRDDILTFSTNSDNQSEIGWDASLQLKNSTKLPARDRIIARRRR